jgi:hypothetical protein
LIGFDAKPVTIHTPDYEVFQRNGQKNLGISVDEHENRSLTVYFSPLKRAATTHTPVGRSSFFAACMACPLCGSKTAGLLLLTLRGDTVSLWEGREADAAGG